MDLRSALDKAGFESTGIVAADGGTDVIIAAEKDAQLAAAIAAFGVHAHLLPPVATNLLRDKP